METPLQVLPSADGDWHVYQGAGRQPISTHSHAWAAEAAAVRTAATRRRTVVVLRDVYGRTRTVSTDAGRTG